MRSQHSKWHQNRQVQLNRWENLALQMPPKSQPVPNVTAVAATAHAVPISPIFSNFRQKKTDSRQSRYVPQSHEQSRQGEVDRLVRIVMEPERRCDGKCNIQGRRRVAVYDNIWHCSFMIVAGTARYDCCLLRSECLDCWVGQLRRREHALTAWQSRLTKQTGLSHVAPIVCSLIHS